QAVADEVDAAAAHPLAQEVAQADARLLDPGRAAVFVGEGLLVPAGPEIRGQGQERAAVGQVSGDEHDRALLRAARSASLRAAETERVEQGGSRQRKQLAPDNPRRGLLRDGKVL